ncbi:hypothetical protein FOIG_12184 [Fusarium odoratissimum NRRL 54006]|uniref:Uncharacterized protein n=5 Tax=Fusarium oxysporum species complex TaxID=171631 RepID=X0J1X2_FUSO5|nr:uncharacterized protein FOIG_12184 [Fusarium odoratissimum NRRL 54006]XP_031057283.1 uncharacterized protein FOIG_12184 [Fusarium odoratissimum NRRL 54006]XP_031057284.1 uncharacterized protein FOIG_12184 [Fusarium odoratissimum NRRL 54006]EXL95192.1 hypothetical protein FOIG_12184 [Fusarium odoratissimum NRRL 54006]EXL95193.1 hypothetical protein FOIG_12184 [Fusarium odoratissimum NRRL 54006]EXL95194.1 hypothetical protein FOIG_12184 [Fusarium odoratissimum NRRL 54006]
MAPFWPPRIRQAGRNPTDISIKGSLSAPNGQNLVQSQNVGDPHMTIREREELLHQIGSWTEVGKCGFRDADGQTLELITFCKLFESFCRLGSAPVNLDVTDILHKQWVAVEVIQKFAAAAETDSLLPKEDAKEFVVECWTQDRWQSLHLRSVERPEFAFQLWTVATHFS